MSTSLPAAVLVCMIVMAGVGYIKSATPRAAPPDNAQVAQEQRAATPLVVACSPEKPMVRYGQAVRMRAWATASMGQPLQYAWTTTSGHIAEQGPEAEWDFTDVRPGPYTATVRVSTPEGGQAECSVQVIVRAPIRNRPPRETGRSFLGPDHQEAEGYGLYSYVLFGSPPSEGSAGRYLETITAYLQLIVDVTRLVQHLPRGELNVTYVPVTDAPPGQNIDKVSAEWVLQHYDYARARVLLRALPNDQRDGPYIVSTLKPLSGTTTLTTRYLYQDLSLVPPHLLALWMKEFMNQAAQERFWEQKTAEQFALKLRTTIGILAEGLPEVRESLQSLIAWAHDA